LKSISLHIIQYLFIPTLIVKNLKLTNFRNYAHADVRFHSHVNALTGKNGMGKTNILDALYYSCLGKSYFSSIDKNVILKDQDFFRIETLVDKNEGVEVIVIKNKSGQRKVIEISGKKMESISAFIGNFLAVIIAPDDVHIMMEGSEDRRNFLNNTIVQTDHGYLVDLLLYNGWLKRRNAILKTFAEQKSFNALLLESVTTPLIEPAIRIYEKRKEYVEKMLPVFKQVYADLSGESEACDISYSSQLGEGSFATLLRSNTDKDCVLGRTTAGIHKDDLIFNMNGEPLKNYASQGQLKSFVLALKITQYKMLASISKDKPLFLLDDIFDKLDESRVKHLLTMLIKEDFGQIFITDTEQDRIRTVLQEIGAAFQLFEVVDGQVSAC